MGDDELYYGDFERDGEEVVRNRVALGVYNKKKQALAKEWLARKNQSRRDSTTSEQTEIARSAKDAAWAAADAAVRAAAAAERSNRKATIALVIAAISVIASIVIPLIFGK